MMMTPRCVVGGLIILLAGFALTPRAARAQPFGEGIAALQITEGAYAGAYRLYPHPDAPLEWYFLLFGLYAYDGVAPERYRAVLETYLRHLDPAVYTVDNFEFASGQPRIADADDSMAAGFLIIAAKYWHASGDRAWFQTRLATIKAIALVNLRNTIKANNLCQTFNNRRSFALAPDKAPFRTVSYCYDNCEVYRGLMDFADVLDALGDGDAAAYRADAARIATGIRSLFDEQAGGFRVADINTRAGETGNFYPDRSIQVGPQLYGVDLGPRTREYYDRAWAYLNARPDDRWTEGVPDNDNPSFIFPNLQLGTTAALRSDSRGQQQFDWYLRERSPDKLQFFSIHELGFAAWTERVLLNQPPRANAGPDRRVTLTPNNPSIRLDGRGSSDPEKQRLTYHWHAPGVRWDNPTSATPSGTFSAGIHLVTLTVTDPVGATSRDSVDITVEPGRVADHQVYNPYVKAYVEQAYGRSGDAYLETPWNGYFAWGYNYSVYAVWCQMYADAVLWDHPDVFPVARDHYRTWRWNQVVCSYYAMSYFGTGLSSSLTMNGYLAWADHYYSYELGLIDLN